MTHAVILIPCLLPLCLLTPAPPPAPPAAPGVPAPPALPVQTSRYNRGGFPGRVRDGAGKVARFALKPQPGGTPVLDGGGREIGRAQRPVMLNAGASKVMPSAGGAPETYLWAWQTEAGSGWVARAALADPPPAAPPDPARCPRPPREASASLVIDAAGGTRKLSGLRHVNSQGVIPAGGGNQGEHYAGRNPGPRDFVYLLFAVPNVRQGGTARDSLPDGSRFLPALDEKGQPILERMTMYREGRRTDPVTVTFLYGRTPGGDRYGWIARANVGPL